MIGRLTLIAVALAALTAKVGIVAVVGAPIRSADRLYNCAVVLANGTVLGVVPKTYLPNYREYYEKRWFAPATARCSKASAMPRRCARSPREKRGRGHERVHPQPRLRDCRGIAARRLRHRTVAGDQCLCDFRAAQRHLQQLAA